MQTKSKRSRILSFVLLHVILLMYSFCSVFSKLAASAEFMSLQFVLYYGLMLLILAAYALLWQQVLKRMPLNTAFANKGVVIVWGMIWGALIFSEAIKWYMIVGALIIFCGIVLVVSGDE